MLFVCDLALPASTPEADPVGDWYPICAGTITRIHVHWPWGAGNLAGLRIYHAGSQRWPLTMTRWFNSSARDVVFEEEYEVDSDDPRLWIEGYNDDDTFSHTPTVYVEVTRRTEMSYVTELLSYAGVEVAVA